MLDDRRFSISDSLPGRNKYSKDAEALRTSWLKENFDIDLEAITEHNINPKQLRGVVENFIGAVQIPIGCAGPLQINGGFAQGVFFAPLATVEGVITLSASRGAKVINESGGINVKILERQMIRAPFFQFANIHECQVFVQWIKDNYEVVKEECEKLSRHGKLLKIEECIVGNSVHLRFCYSTGDAAGQNMVTIMTDGGCMYISNHFEKETNIPIRIYTVEGNFGGDKKANFVNFNSSRGARVITETFLKKESFERIFNCTVKQFMSEAKNADAGAVASGTPGGFSINAANIIAAIYAATGQDLGCVFESSVEQIFYEEHEDGIYYSTTFPGIVTGTISSAQRLPTQNSCLKLMKCDTENGALKLAEIIAAFSVALDISTLASVANNSFSKAHRIWGRS